MLRRLLLASLLLNGVIVSSVGAQACGSGLKEDCTRGSFGQICPKIVSLADCDRNFDLVLRKMRGTKRPASEQVAKNLSSEQTAIALAIIKNDRKNALDLIDRSTGTLVFPVYDGGGTTVTPLAVAAQRGDVEMVRTILDKHVPVDSVLDSDPSKQIYGITALQACVQSAVGTGKPVDQYLATISLLLERGASPHVRDASFRQTALGMALKIWYGDKPLATRIVDLLLSAGADINEISQDGVGPEMTALSSAASAARLPLLRFLLDRGADPRAHGSIALIKAVNDNEIEVAKLLLTKGADANAALRDPSPMLFVERSRPMLLALLNAGGDPNTCDQQTEAQKRLGVCPLLGWAVVNADEPLARMLIDRGANPNATDADGDTVLGELLARKKRNSRTDLDKSDLLGPVKMLLAHGADPNLRSAGRLPLTVVSDDEHEVIAALLDHRAKSDFVKLANGEIVGPITVAIHQHRFFLAAELLRRSKGRLGGDEAYALRAAVANQRLDLAKQLLAAGADARGRGPLGETPLHIAAQFRDVAMVQFLIASGADPNARTAPLVKLKAASLPPAKGPEIYQIVGAPWLVDGNETPLMVAATTDSQSVELIDTVKALLAAGASTTLRSDRGKTARDWAEQFFNSSVEPLLARRPS